MLKLLNVNLSYNLSHFIVNAENKFKEKNL